MRLDGIQHFLVVSGRASADIECPAGFPVVDNSSLYRNAGADDSIQLFMNFADAGHFLKDPGIFMSNVINYSAVKFFTATFTFTPLKIHRTVSAVAHCQQHFQLVNAGALQPVMVFPV